MTKLFSLKGAVQNYAWGGNSFISELLGIEKENKPCAEYWLGAHTNAPSTLLTTEGKKTLDTYIASDKVKVLGKKVASEFGRLPFLLKVLDVSEMLSIQVHPTKEEAEKGFAYENGKGIPLSAPNRNYKDDNHKPEIMVALSEFWLLHGFLPKSKLEEVLKETIEFSELVSVFEKEGYFGLYKKVMEFSDEENNALLRPLLNRIVPLYLAGKLEKSSPDYWAAKAVNSSLDKPILDKGIYSIYFFNIVKVRKGEAVFQDAGVPHAYLEGQNIELMANSDNVIRGGLTPKHVDVPELLRHISFDETHPNIFSGDLQKDGLERIYKTPAPDFELSQIHLSISDVYTSVSETAEIFIVTQGEVTIEEEDTSLLLKKGNCAFLTIGSNYKITTTNNSTIFKATAP